MSGQSAKKRKTAQIPVLDIREFLSDQQSVPDFQYHEITGKRAIEKFHKHDFFLFLLFEQGSGNHSIDFMDHKVTDHQVHILFPHQVHKWTLGVRTKAFQLMISKRIFETFSSSLDLSFLLYQKHPVVSLSLRPISPISSGLKPDPRPVNSGESYKSYKYWHKSCTHSAWAGRTFEQIHRQ